jgi:hypothetical protein
MSDHTPLAQEIAAQIQLGLPGTVGKLAKQLRAIDRIAPQLKAGGLVRRLTVDREVRRRAVGVAVAHRKISAFGGLLYSAAALGHELSAVGGDIAHTRQLSRMDVGDMDLLEADRRQKWKCYSLVYDLLDELFAADTLPELVILDVPLVMGKAVYAQVLEDAETNAVLKRDIGALKERIEGFWDRWVERCYPLDPSGPKVVSLHRGRFGSLLKLVEKRGADVSPDPIDPEVEELVGKKWVDVLSVGIDRVLRGILVPEHRTAAFEQDQDRLDKAAFPRAIVDRGRLAFHYLTGLRGEPVYVETLGSAAAWVDRGGADALDALAGDLLALTYFDARHAVPLPLWYAQSGVGVVKRKQKGRGVLEFYKAEALRAMREEQVDQAWLAGWEDE